VPEEADKAVWRRRLVAARASLSPARLAVAAEQVGEHVLSRLDGATRIAAYVPVGTEPGSLDLLDRLRDRGTVVLLPVVQPNYALTWAAYLGSEALTPGPWGLRQPATDPGEPGGLGTVQAILVPALAVDERGTRLGRGSGYYDRALRGVPASVPVAALLHDGELVGRLPADPWDRPVTAAVTPTRGWTNLPLVAHHVS
jgi:5-formyltetrahydrofolate cyclo-ligase